MIHFDNVRPWRVVLAFAVVGAVIGVYLLVGGHDEHSASNAPPTDTTLSETASLADDARAAAKYPDVQKAAQQDCYLDPSLLHAVGPEYGAGGSWLISQADAMRNLYGDRNAGIAFMYGCLLGSRGQAP